MLHGEIKVNHNVIGEWIAQNAGPRLDSGIYRCWVFYTDIAGYRHERRFFIKHNYGDGALVLAANVMLEFHKRIDWPAKSEEHDWLDFCEMHKLDPIADLGRHVSALKKEKD